MTEIGFNENDVYEILSVATLLNFKVNYLIYSLIKFFFVPELNIKNLSNIFLNF